MTKRLLVGIKYSALAICLTTFALLVAKEVSLRMRNTNGILQDMLTRQPIAGAELTLDCKRAKFFHGSETLRVVRTTTSEDGRFSYGIENIRDCHYLWIYPKKEGYQDAYVPDSAVTVEFKIDNEVPAYLYMVRNSDIPQLRLNGLLNQSIGVRESPRGPMPLEDYMAVNTPFFRSVAIASTPEQIDWVQQRYCERLARLWAEVPESERKKVVEGKFADVVQYAEVDTYCQKRP